MWHNYGTTQPTEARELVVAEGDNKQRLWQYLTGPQSVERFNVDEIAATLPNGCWVLSAFFNDGHVFRAEITDGVVQGIDFVEEPFELLPWESVTDAQRRAESCGEVFPVSRHLTGQWSECFGEG